MTILITGAAGYIGSHVAYALLDAGERLVAIDDLSTGFRHSLPGQLKLIVGSAGDAELICATISAYDVRAIIHFAGSVVVPESVCNPLEYYRNNTSNSRNLIEAAVLCGVRDFIFSSTAAVYGDPVAIPIGEDAQLAPRSPYGWSKLMTEVMLRDAYAAHGLRHIIMRYFNVAGADPGLRTGQSTAGATHLIKVAIETALGIRSRIDVFGTDYPTPDGTCIRDYIHVSDLARAHVDALLYLRGGGAPTTLNCGYGRGYSVLEVISAVKKLSGVDFQVDFAGRRLGDPAEIVAQCDRVKGELRWKPQYVDLDTIISHALAWERRLQTTNLA